MGCRSISAHGSPPRDSCSRSLCTERIETTYTPDLGTFTRRFPRCIKVLRNKTWWSSYRTVCVKFGILLTLIRITRDSVAMAAKQVNETFSPRVILQPVHTFDSSYASVCYEEERSINRQGAKKPQGPYKSTIDTLYKFVGGTSRVRVDNSQVERNYLSPIRYRSSSFTPANIRLRGSRGAA